MPSISKGPDVGSTPLSFLASRITVLCLVLFLPVAADSQQKQKPEPSSGMGVTTGAAHAAVKDSQHRPITAGGFVDNAPVVFVDATKEAGLDKFHHHSGTPGKATILETMGSGVALLDYDNDGWLDIFLLNGSTEKCRANHRCRSRAMP